MLAFLALSMATGAEVELQIAVGDGSVAVTVDALGCIAAAAGGSSFDPPGGPSADESVTYLSAVVLRDGSVVTPLCTRNHGYSGAVPPWVPSADGTWGTVDATSAHSTFTAPGDLTVALDQVLEVVDGGAGPIGARLVQSYTFTNGGSTPASFEAVRYYDGDLDFTFTSSGFDDGGGHLVDTSDWLFESDNLVTRTTNGPVVAITASGGTRAPGEGFAVGRYYDDVFSVILGQAPLSGAVHGDTTGDGFVDALYDVALALADGLEIDPGTSVDYETVTHFVYAPAELVTCAGDDADGDGVGDACDPCPDTPDDGADADGDGIGDACDACPVVHDDGSDTDGDDIPDACDPCPTGSDGEDSDDDGVADACDPCPGTPDDGADRDGDGLGDACDPCPTWPDDGTDTDVDGLGDACDLCPEDADAVGSDPSCVVRSDVDYCPTPPPGGFEVEVDPEADGPALDVQVYPCRYCGWEQGTLQLVITVANRGTEVSGDVDVGFRHYPSMAETGWFAVGPVAPGRGTMRVQPFARGGSVAVVVTDGDVTLVEPVPVLLDPAGDPCPAWTGGCIRFETGPSAPAPVAVLLAWLLVVRRRR